MGDRLTSLESSQSTVRARGRLYCFSRCYCFQMSPVCSFVLTILWSTLGKKSIRSKSGVSGGPILYRVGVTRHCFNSIFLFQICASNRAFSVSIRFFLDLTLNVSHFRYPINCDIGIIVFEYIPLTICNAILETSKTH